MKPEIPLAAAPGQGEPDPRLGGHRVAGSDGKLTGYGGELWRKEYLLALEQAQAFHLS